MNAAIIGTSKIAQIHLREILKKNFKKIYIVTRSFNNTKKKISKFRNHITTKIILVRMKNLLRLRFSFISICSPTSLHHKNIFFLKNKKKTIIFVEKPLISYLGLSKNFEKIYNRINNLKLRVVVSYPMYYMASAFLKIFKINVNKIKNINIYYHTRGIQKRSYIAEDLLPHALSFFFRIFQKKIKNLNFISSKTKVSISKWSCKIKFNNLNLNIFFSQNVSYKESRFYFEIDGNKYVRKLVYKNSVPVTSIKYNNYNKIIENPMIMNLRHVLNYKNFHSLSKINKKITFFVFSIKKKLLNNELC
jgi:hypothetical protein